MKQFLIILSLMVIGSVGVVGLHMAAPHASIPIASRVTHPLPLPSSTKTPDVGNPITLDIPSLGVEANIEKVGLDPQNRMDVPKQVEDVGWYDLGYKPGEKGNAVVDGHFDKSDGSPAVFYRISSLKEGDDLIVKDENKHTFDFKVFKIAEYPFDKLPLQDIFTGNKDSELILITCSGIWDRGTQNYSTRTVVYSSL